RSKLRKLIEAAVEGRIVEQRDAGESAECTSTTQPFLEDDAYPADCGDDGRHPPVVDDKLQSLHLFLLFGTSFNQKLY
ncbi:MAG: hypothetical protein V4436_03255, partial [Patescibacteria group bacterium]